MSNNTILLFLAVSQNIAQKTGMSQKDASNFSVNLLSELFQIGFEITQNKDDETLSTLVDSYETQNETVSI